MQLVKKEMLQELLSQDMHEAKSSSSIKKDFNYNNFKKAYSTVKTNAALNSSQPDYFLAYEHLRDDYLSKYSPPIKFISEGSSRAAFACLGGKCLKIAINNKGIALNALEIKNSFNDSKSYSCFTLIYDFDSINYGSLFTECAAKMTTLDFNQSFNLKYGSDSITNILMIASDNNFDLNQMKSSLESKTCTFEPKFFSVREPEEIEEIIAFLANLLKKTDPQWKVMQDLFRFYRENKQDDMIWEDIVELDNWGLAIRENKIVPVILDAGFSEIVYRTYYR